MATRFPISFAGSQVFEHEFRVFVQGIDVTQWVDSYSCNYNLDMGGADITFKNPGEVLVLTYANITGVWKLDDGKSPYSESVKKEIFDRKTAMNNKVTNSEQAGNAENAGFDRWPLYPPTPIFQKMDTVRIYAAVPWLSKNDDKRWIPIFCGYVGSVNATRTYGAGDSMATLSVSCNTLKAVLQKTRIATNPMVTDESLRITEGGDGRIVDQNELVGIFQDSVAKFSTQTLMQRKPNEVISYLIFGSYVDAEGRVERSSESISGVGFLGKSASSRFYMPAEERIWNGERYTLQEWNDGCLYGASDDGKNRSAPLTFGEMYAQGINSYTDGPFCPHGSNVVVRFLNPPSGFGYTGLHDPTPSSHTTQADFVTRLDLIDQALAPIAYKFWIAGTGDLVFELPMSDFDLEDYGEYKQILTIDSYSSDSYSENDVDVPTSLTVTGGIPSSGVSAEGNKAYSPFRVDILCAALAARFGIVQETISFPYTMNNDSLAMFGVAFLQQKLAELETLGITDCGFKLGMFPNRPAFVTGRRVLAAINEISINQSSSGSGNTFSPQLVLLRKPDAKGHYRTLFGSVRLPGSYAKRFLQGVGGGASNNVEGLDIKAGTDVGSGTSSGGGSASSGSGYNPADHPTTPGNYSGADVSQANIDRLNAVQITPEQAASIKSASGGDPEKEAFLTNVLKVENRGNKNIRMNNNTTSWAGAKGAFQVMPATARGLGMTVNDQQDDRTDFNKSAQGAGKLYDELHERTGGNKAAMYAGYNGGTKAMNAVLAGKQPGAKETRDYVGMANHLEKSRTGNSILAEQDQAMTAANEAAAKDKPSQFAGQIGQYAKENGTALSLPYTTDKQGSEQPNTKVAAESPDPNPQFTENTSKAGFSKVTPQGAGELSAS